jgi:hypothetical protein
VGWNPEGEARRYLRASAFFDHDVVVERCVEVHSRGTIRLVARQGDNDLPHTRDADADIGEHGLSVPQCGGPRETRARYGGV